MIKVIFLQEQSRINGGIVYCRYARLISREEELGFSSDWKEKLFVGAVKDDGEDAKVEGVSILETEDADILHTNGALKLVENILSVVDIKPEVICSTSLKHFFDIYKEAESGELDLKVIKVNSSNEVLYYSMCGENDSTLLIAYGSPDEIAG